jgi:hypothetical protein
MELTLKDLKTIIIVSIIGASLYILAHTAIMEGLKPDYKGNDLSLEAVQTLIKVNAGLANDP